MKKTALDDDAYLYQKREQKTEKQKWAEMNSVQRRKYFLDYYLIKVIILAAFILTAGIFIWNFIRKSNEETVLYVAVIDENLDKENLEEFTKEITEYLGADGKKQKVVIDDSIYTQDGGLQKLEVYLYNKQIDVIISNKNMYSELAGYGFFQDMNEVLGEASAEYRDNYIEAAGYKDSEEVSFEDNETGQGEKLPYGVDISESSKFNSMKKNTDTPVLSVALGAPNKENAIKFLNFIMEAEKDE